MKKLFLSMGLMFAALTLTNCSQDATEDLGTPSPVGKGFSFAADFDESRASLDGYKTVFENGDTVFFGSEETNMSGNFVELPKYTYADGLFKNADAVFESGKTYNFYSIWTVQTTYSTHRAYINDETPRFQYASIGQLTNHGAITQTGDSDAHVPEYSVYYWVGKGLEASDDLKVTYKHAETLMKFVVTNDGEEAATINSLTLTAPTGTDIAGTFYINFDGTITGSGATYVFNTQTVNIKSAPELKKGESMNIWMPLAPFSLKSGDQVNIAISASTGDCHISKAVSKDTTFEAGKVNTQKLSFVPAETPAEPITVKELNEMINSGVTTFTGIKVSGVIAAVARDAAQSLSSGTLMLTDNTGEDWSGIIFYNNGTNGFGANNAAFPCEPGDLVTIDLTTATVNNSRGYNQIETTSANDFAEDIEETGIAIKAKVITIAEYLAEPKAYVGMKLQFNKVKPTAASIGKTFNDSLIFTDGTNELTVYNRTQWTDAAQSYVGITAANPTITDGTLYAYGNFYNNPQVTMTKVDDAAPFVAKFALSTYNAKLGGNTGAETKVDVVYTAENCRINTVSFAIGATVDWCNPALEGNAVKITALKDNDTGEPRSVQMMVSAIDNTTYSSVYGLFTVTQNVAGAADAKYVKVTSTPEDWSGSYLMVVDQLSKALSSISTTSTPYGLATDVTISGDAIASTDENSSWEITIAKGSNGGYTMKFNDGYLNWTTGNSLNTVATASANTEWTLVATADGVIITNVADANRVIFWNIQSPRFATYTSSGKPGTGYYYPALYKLDGSGSTTPGGGDDGGNTGGGDTGGDTGDTDNTVFDFTQLYSSVTNGSQSVDGVPHTSEGVTVTFNKASASTAPSYYFNGMSVRCYGGGTINITGKTITKVELVFASGGNANKPITANAGTYTDIETTSQAGTGVWEGSTDNLTFTVEAGSGHRRIEAIKVTCK